MIGIETILEKIMTDNFPYHLEDTDSESKWDKYKEKHT